MERRPFPLAAFLAFALAMLFIGVRVEFHTRPTHSTPVASRPTPPTVWYTSNHPNVAVVDPLTGVVTPLNPGTAEICEQQSKRCQEVQVHSNIIQK